MKKALRIGGIVGASLLGLVLLVLLLLPLVLNSRALTRLVDKFAAEYIDGDLEYSRIRVSLYRDFPRVGVTLEDVALTYPHERFAQFDTLPAPNPMLDAGRGIPKDTLARFGTLDASVNILRLLRGEIRVEKAVLNRFAAFAHNYGEAANWDILHFPQTEKKKEGFDLPRMFLRELRIDGDPTVVYTAQQDDTYATARFLQFLLEGEGKLSSESTRLENVRLAWDSLRIFGRIPQDTLDLRLDYLHIDEPGEQAFNLGLAAAARVRTEALGSLVLPLRADGRVSFTHQPQRFDLGVEQLDARLAQLPLHVEGQAAFLPGQIDLNALASIPDCPLDSLLRLYLDHYLQISRDIRTDARLSVAVSANGTYSQESVPHLIARVRIPQSHSSYRPLDLSADLVLDADAEMSPQKRLDARIRTFDARIPGARVNLDGKASDLLGGNALFDLHAKADASLGPLVRRFVPAKLGIREAGGNARLDLQASVTQQELRTFRFQDADIRGTLLSDSLYAVVPDDTIDARIWRTRMNIASNRSGLRLNLNLDSIYLDKGVQLQARVRDMRNGGQLTKVPVREQMATRLALSTENGQLFAKFGSSRAGADDARINLATTQRILPSDDARKRELDALQEKYPDVPRADLAARLTEQNLHRPPRPHDDFADSDLAIALNETFAQMMREWSSSGSVLVDSAFFASPQFPLRTRLTALSASFTDNSVDLDSLSVTSGSSDLRAAGYVTGLRAVTTSNPRGEQLEAQFNLESNRLNINELTAAIQAGHPDKSKVEPAEEKDESFVTDDLRDAPLPDEKMSLVVVPGNLRTTVGIQIDTIDYAEMQIGPVLAAARIQDRTAQILGTHVFTDVGHVALDGFYATRSPEDISAGVNINLRQVDIPGIIGMIRHADELPPVVTSMQGRLDCEVSATTQIDTNMNVVIPSLDGLVRISGKDLEVKDAGDLRRITRLLLFRNKNIGRIEDLTIDAVAHNSQLEIFPFELSVDRYRLALLGMQGLDRSMYYHASILRSPFLIRFGINIFGTLDHWRFSLSRARYRDGNLPVFTQQLDSVQVNIAQGIRDIFKSGARRVRDYNLSRERPVRQMDDELLSSEEYGQIDELLLLAELEEQNEELLAEVDDAIAQASLDTDRLVKQYTEQVYDKRILRKMEKMKKKQQKTP